MKTSEYAISISHEFRNADLGHQDRTDRLCQIVEDLARAPSSTLPNQCKDVAKLEGTYRFVNNPLVSAEAILAAHQACTVARARTARSILVLHDTTSFLFGGVGRQGLGPLKTKAIDQGFFSHFSICVDRNNQPLGSAGLHAWARSHDRRSSKARQISQSDPDSEAWRWQNAVEQTGELLVEVEHVVHVMDREGDSIELIGYMLEHGHKFIVRVAHDRRLDPDRKARDVAKLYDSLAAAPFFVERRVPLVRRGSPRGPVRTDVWGQVESRDAVLTIRAGSFTISPGNGAAYHLPKELELNYVEVVEQNPPADMEPVHWRLMTTELLKL